MEFLTVSAGLYRIHHDILGRHERKLTPKMPVNDFLIDDKTVRDIYAKIQYTVKSEESFRNGQTLIGRIVKRTLEPLRRRCDRRIQCVDHNVS